MRDFFRRHQVLLLIVVPLMVLAGISAGPLAGLVAALAVGYFFYVDRHDSIILLLVLVLVMGDSRIGYFQFFKSLRIEVLVLMFLISLYEIRNGYYRFSVFFLYFLPFLFVAMLSLIFCPMLGLGLSKTISFGIFYFVGLHYIHNKFEKLGMQLIEDLLYLCHVILLLGLLILPIQVNMVTYGGGRFNGLLGNPNGMGMFVTLVTPIALYVFSRSENFSKRFKLITWVILFASIIMCSSRNSLFSVAIFFMLHYGLVGGSFKRIAFVFVFLPLAGIFLYNIKLEALVYDLGLERYFRVKDFESGSGRIFAWQHAVDLIKKSPLIGCGFSCEEYNFIWRTSFRLWHTGHQGGVHNSYLAFMINTGIVGFALYMGFLANIFRKIRNRRFLIAYLVSVLFSAVFESWLFSSLGAFHILFLVFLIFLLVDTNKEELLVSRLAGDFSKLHESGNIG